MDVMEEYPLMYQVEILRWVLLMARTKECVKRRDEKKKKPSIASNVHQIYDNKLIIDILDMDENEKYFYEYKDAI